MEKLRKEQDDGQGSGAFEQARISCFDAQPINNFHESWESWQCRSHLRTNWKLRTARLLDQISTFLNTHSKFIPHDGQRLYNVFYPRFGVKHK